MLSWQQLAVLVGAVWILLSGGHHLCRCCYRVSLHRSHARLARCRAGVVPFGQFLEPTFSIHPRLVGARIATLGRLDPSGECRNASRQLRSDHCPSSTSSPDLRVEHYALRPQAPPCDRSGPPAPDDTRRTAHRPEFVAVRESLLERIETASAPAATWSPWTVNPDVNSAHPAVIDTAASPASSTPEIPTVSVLRARFNKRNAARSSTEIRALEPSTGELEFT